MSGFQMASRQVFRRISPLLCKGSRVISFLKPSIHLHRHTVPSENLLPQVTALRFKSSEAHSEIINIQDEDDFQKRVIDSKKPVVVDFHATWCGPCKLLGPRLETIVSGEKGKVVMAKVDIDENVELAMKYNVQSVPTIYGVKNGKIVKSFIGLKEDDEIQSFVKSLL